jgi:hypothetical protein
MSVFYSIKIEIDPVAEAAWYEWNTRHHIPDVLSQPGFLRATQYKLDAPAGEWSQYLVLYEVATREALDEYLSGEAVIRLRADHFERFGAVTRSSRMVLTPIATVEKPPT